jgi:hypothetical protein
LQPHGGVAQWTTHPPQEKKARVRIPPGEKVFRETCSAAFLHLKCIVFVLKQRNECIGLKIFKKNKTFRYVFVLQYTRQ